MAPEVEISIVVPVYRNEAFVPELVERLAELDGAFSGAMEAVIVVDGSPDRSAELLIAALDHAPFRTRLLLLSRNFGSFSAIRAGLEAGTGRLFAVMAADLQEPADLYPKLREALLEGNEIVVGTRESRADPWLSRLFSGLFWRCFRALAIPEFPISGVDVFACTREFRDHLLVLRERRSSLIGLAYWLGFERAEVTYRRLPRRYGRSAWSFGRKLSYLLDSVFAFSDLPVRLLLLLGVAGLTLSAILGTVVLALRLTGGIPIPGYAATVLIVMFFGALNSFGLGLIGEYVWRTFENTKQRPGFVVARSFDHPGMLAGPAQGRANERTP